MTMRASKTAQIRPREALCRLKHDERCQELLLFLEGRSGSLANDLPAMKLSQIVIINKLWNTLHAADVLGKSHY